MSSSPPIKPPRGMKQTKDTVIMNNSGFLMSVIKTLSTSENNEQRDREKAKLEKEYKKCDQRLDELVSAHNSELAQVMQVFGSVSSYVAACRLRVRGVRARLAGCKQLLRWKRDELHRLAKEGAQHKHVLAMLTQIEQLTKVGAELNSYISKGQYLNSAIVLKEALNTAQNNLLEVEALHHLRTDLEAKKQLIYDKVLKELSMALYAINNDEIGLKTQGSTRKSEVPRLSNNKLDAVQEINPQLEIKLTEETKTLRLRLSLLVESLATINMAKESLELIKVQIQIEMLDVVSKASIQVLDYGSSQLPAIQSNALSDTIISTLDMTKKEELDAQAAQPLVELMELLLHQCRIISERHQLLLDIWKQTMKKHNIQNVQLYSMNHYWSRVQAVLQLLLTDYLDIQSLKTGPQRLTYQQQPANFDINSYFIKKKPQSKKRCRLIKLSISNASGSTTGGGSGGGDAMSGGMASWKLVCTPSSQHLVHIYGLLDTFLTHIESKSGLSECSLRVFLSELMKGAHAERVATSLNNLILEHCSQPGSWRELLLVPAGPHVNKTLFKCTVTVWEACEWALRDSLRLGALGGKMVQDAIIPALKSLIAAAKHRIGQLVPRAKSQVWLRDDDITRFLKALPNWSMLKNPPAKGRKEQEVREIDIKQSFEREAEILGSSLGDGNVNEKEIVININLLRDVAIMCETLEWLAKRVSVWVGIEETIVKTLKENVKEKRPSAYDALLKELGDTAVAFHNLSDNCLLLLHLEVRMQCFHYLGRLNGWLTSGQTDESPTVCLARILQSFFQQIGPILNQKRLQYIMQGLGEMMSAVIVNGWRGSGEGVNGAVVQLEPLRHCLTAAHLSPKGLHKATLYLHMLNMSHEEILQMVSEKGATFSELEYMNAFQVIAKSKSLPDTMLKANLTKLSNILGHVGVTV